MLHALLLFALLPPWVWDPVTRDCRGGLEAPGMRYLVTQLQTEPAGFVTACAIDEETGEQVCWQDIVYQPIDIVSQTMVAVPSFPQESVAVPPLGGVTFIDVEAVDLAGNVSGGVCE